MSASLLALPASGADTRFVYDELGRLIQVVAADGTNTQYAYDPAGNITAVAANQVTTLAITDFMPGSGVAGYKVVISGSGFSATPAANTVLFNGISAVVTAATTSTLSVIVPPAATSGPITVSNSNGSVTTANSFVVGSDGLAPTISGFTPGIGSPGTSVVLAGTNFQSAAIGNKVMFGGVAGLISSVSSSTSMTATVPTVAQSGKITVSTTSGSGASSTDFYVLPAGVAASTVSGTGRIVIDGAAANSSIGVPGNLAMLIFDGVTGQQVSLGVAAVNSAPSDGAGNFVLTVYNPNGTVLTSCQSNLTAVCKLPALPQTGNYRILTKIDTSHTGTISLLLSSIQTGVLTADASATTFGSTRVGQSARYTFSGTAGQSFNLVWSGATFPGYWSYLTVLAPNGATLASQYFGQAYTDGELALPNLAQTGTYTIIVDPYNGTTGQVGIQLLKAVSATLTKTSPLAVTQAAGASGSYTFDGVVGQHLGLGVSALSVTPAGTYANVSILAPDGSTLVSCGSYSAAGSCNLPTLAVTGQYRVMVTPYNSSTAISATLTLSEDLVGTLKANDAATTFSTALPGQNGRYTFDVIAGQNMSLAYSGATLPGYWNYLTVFAPDGSTLASQYFNGDSYYANGVLQMKNLQQTGTYTVFVDPLGASVGQVALQLLADTTGTLAVDGTPLAINLANGATGRYTFTGVTGQAIGLGMSNFVMSNAAANMQVSVVGPSQVTTLVDCGSYGVSGSCNLPALPADGTYTVVVAPSTQSTALTATLTLTTDASGTLVANAAPTVFATTRAGQNAHYAFSATAGQNVTLGWTGSTFSGNWSYLNVYAPDGSLITSQYFADSSYANGAIQLTNLQQTGTYRLVVDPMGASVGQVNLQLSSAVGTLVVDGVPLAVNQAANTSGRYTFIGNAGQQLGLGVSNLALTPSGGYISLTVLAPDKLTVVMNCGSYSDGIGGSCNLPALPTTGAYTVVLTSSSATSTVTASLTLSTDLTGTLVANAPASTFVTARPGQNGHYTFTATGGDNRSIVWSGATLPGTWSYLNIYGPNGAQLTSQYFGDSNPAGQINLSNMQQTGTYTVSVDPYGAGTGQVSLQLLAPAMGSLAVDGATLPISQVAGASGRYTFAGTAGQRLGLGISNLVLTPAGGYASVSIIAPDKVTTVTSCSTYSTDGNCNLPTLGITGTYTIVVTPSNALVAVSANLTLSTDITGTLTANGAASTFVTSRPGQNGRYAFNATAGQNLSLTWTNTTLAGIWSYITIYDPSGGTLASQYFDNSNYPNGILQFNNLQKTGTYTVFVDPFGSTTGQVGLQLLAPTGGNIAVDGASMAISQLAGESGRYTFTGTTGQHLGLGISNLVASTGGSANVSVLLPDGVTTFVSCGTYGTSAGCNLPALPTAGNYTVLITPSSAKTAITATLALSSDVVASIAVDHPPTSFATSRPGQNGRYTFNATAGQNITITWSGTTYSGIWSTFSVLAPNGTPVGYGYFDSQNSSDGTLTINNLQQTGTYTIFVDPYQDVTGRVGLGVTGAGYFSVPAQTVNGTLAVNGAALAISQAAGVSGRYTFSGTVGEQLGLGIANLSLTGGGSYYVSVIAPDNTTTLINCGGFSAVAGCDLPDLPSSGTYTVLVTPSDANTTVAASLNLSDELVDSLTANSAPISFVSTVPGKNALYHFAATAGQNMTIAYNGATFDGYWSYFYVLAPDHSTVTSQLFGTQNPTGLIQLPNLSQTGTYTLAVYPYAAATGQVGLQLTTAASGTLAVDGAPLAISQAAGVSGRYTFTGSTGQRVGLGLINMALAGGSSVAVSVIAPDNVTTVISCGSFSGDSNCRMTLPSDGMYTVLIVPSSSVTSLSANLLLSNDIAGTVTLDAPATVFNPARAGQDANYTFNAVAGQNLTLAWSGATFPAYWSYLYVYAPDGAQLISQYFGVGLPTGIIQLSNLPQSGAYSIVVVPAGASPGQVSLQLRAGVAGALVIDGTPLAISQAANTTGRYIFSGTTGQRVGLGISGMALAPDGASVVVSVVSPDNATTLISCGSYSADASCNLPDLPSTGTYTIVIAPNVSGTALTASLTLSTEITGTLAANAAPTTFAITRAGQNGRYSFSGNAGQSMTLNWTGATLQGAWSYLTVYAPNGTQVASQYFSRDYNPDGQLQLTNLPQSGNYSVIVDPAGTTIGQMNLQIVTPTTGNLVIDGDTLPIQQLAGASGLYNFSGTVGQHLGLAFSGVSGLSSGAYGNMRVIAPDNSTVLVSCPSIYGDGSCNLPALPSTGTYTVSVWPSDVLSALKGNLTLSSDLTATLTLNAAATTFASSRPGQNGRYAFTASAGQNLTLAWSGATVPGIWSYMTIYGPDGAQVANQYFDSNNYPSGLLQLPNLSRTGTYTIFIDPYGAGTGQVSLQLLSPASATVAVDGASAAITQVAGASGRYTFAGTVGQHLGLGISDIAITGGGTVTVAVLAPDGLTTLINCGTYSGNGACNLPALPSTGTYTMLIVPSSVATAFSANLTLSSDRAGQLLADAAPTGFVTSRTGQNGRFTFTATAGQSFTLKHSDVTFSGIWTYATVYAPNGAVTGTDYMDVTNNPLGVVQLANLPQTGTYTVFVDPYGATTGQANLQLLSTVRGAVTVGGAALSISQMAGATGRYTFAATAGQQLRLDYDSLTLSAGGSVTINVLSPDGVTSIATFSANAASGNFNVPSLSSTGLNNTGVPATGTYTVLVVPSNPASAVSANFTIKQFSLVP